MKKKNKKSFGSSKHKFSYLRNKGHEKKSPQGPSQAAKEPVTRVGELSLHRDGYGFVMTEKEGEEDVFVPAMFIGNAFHTDIVEVEVIKGRRGRFEGRIRKIVERRMKTIMGRIERHSSGFCVVADDKRVKHTLQIPEDKRKGARHTDNVLVKIIRYPEDEVAMLGEVIDILGKRGEMETEKVAIVARHQLATEFPIEVGREIEHIDKLIEDGYDDKRKDLRDIPFITIDGETAKDFDDAVAVKKLENGNIRLYVSIADVSHFVRRNTALDKEAMRRGTSVYFSDSCLPMLPEKLSNNLCSLRPNEDRLTVTAEIDIDRLGQVIRTDFYKSIIKSKERMTYTSIKNILLDKEPLMLERYKGILKDLHLMEECYNRLNQVRSERGSVDFDLPEPAIIMDIQGGIQNIVKAERHIGHMIIEDFMIAANEAVARFLTDKIKTCIYRAHGTPPADKVMELATLLNNLNHRVRLGANSRPKDYRHIVELVRGRPEERLVNHMLLRSMAQAVYSTENIGHFGLASTCYCHFTSPIRRYPDLIVHRLIKSILDNKKGRLYEVAELDDIARETSRLERIAMEAEREMAKLYAATFMQGHVGEIYEGIICHVAKFGIFVELIDFFVEGVVRLEDMTDDWYYLSDDGVEVRGKKKKGRYRIGDKVKIEVSEVDIPMRELRFLLV